MSEIQQPALLPGTGVSGSTTETSPLLGEGSRTETIVEINQEPTTETKRPTGTSEPSTLVQIGTTESGEEFRPAVDCTETTACPHASGSGEHENLDDSIGPNRCCAVGKGIFKCWFSASERLPYSWLVLPLQLVLLVLPVSAGYMGATYMDDCPMSAPSPLLVFMMGLVGSVVVSCRIGLLIAKKFIPFENCQFIENIVVIGCFALLLFYCTELLCFSKSSPNFQVGAQNFCHETFYDFTYYANWAFFGVIICAKLLYLPYLIAASGCYRNI